MGGRKRQNLTLDLNSASPKKNKVQNLLTSPEVQMPGELRSEHGHRDGSQHSRHPELRPVWPAGASVSSPPSVISSKHLPLPHLTNTK